MANVIISDPAIADIDSILDYISRDDPKIARIFVQTIFKKIELLGKFPELGKITEISHQIEIRTLLHKNYRIIYRLKEESVEILRIIHTSRSFDRF